MSSDLIDVHLRLARELIGVIDSDRGTRTRAAYIESAVRRIPSIRAAASRIPARRPRGRPKNQVSNGK